MPLYSAALNELEHVKNGGAIIGRTHLLAFLHAVQRNHIEVVNEKEISNVLRIFQTNHGVEIDQESLPVLLEVCLK